MKLSPDMIPPLLTWHAAVRRPLPWRESPDPYRIWISEIMLQQTRIEAVIPYYRRFIAALPTVRALAEVDEGVLMKLWEGLGYYSRARNLKRAADRIVSEYGGALPADREALMRLPGIGEYTAGAIGSIAFGLPTPAVDGNVLRVLARITADERNILLPAVKREAQSALGEIYPTGELAKELTEGLMELGQTVCIPGAPRCGECPLAGLCLARARGVEGRLPNRAKRTARAVEERTVFMAVFDKEVGIFRRPPEGLLGGLFELPSADGHLSKEEAGELLSGFGLSVASIEKGPCAKHVFTHLEWHMSSYFVTLKEKGGGLTFAGLSALRGEYAVPTAFRKFISYLAERLSEKKER